MLVFSKDGCNVLDLVIYFSVFVPVISMSYLAEHPAIVLRLKGAK